MCVLVLEDVYAYVILVYQITTLGSWFLPSTLLRQGWSCFCHLIASWLAGPWTCSWSHLFVGVLGSVICSITYGFVVVVVVVVVFVVVIVVVVTSGNQIHICRFAKPSSWPYSDLFLKPHLLGGGSLVVCLESLYTQGLLGVRKWPRRGHLPQCTLNWEHTDFC